MVSFREAMPVEDLWLICHALERTEQSQFFTLFKISAFCESADQRVT